MKSNYLFTSMLALTTVVVASCSAPRLAQQNSNDDVYNSVAQAKEYRQQVPVREEAYDEEQYDDYGSSDPYYDMDYSSRINRFSYANPSWRGYYDPYFDGGWYGNYGMSLGFGFGMGFSPFYGSMWNSPYHSWGNLYSPFWGYNNYYGSGYYGGGYYGGGLWGGGYLGSGFYTGRTTPVDYKARPNRGNSSGYMGRNSGVMVPRTSRGQANTNGTPGYSRPSRGNATGTNRPTNTGTRPTRTEATRPATESSRPTRTESSRPARTESSRPAPVERPSRPTRESYTPPPSYNPPSRSGGSSGGSSGGTSRPSRGGR